MKGRFIGPIGTRMMTFATGAALSLGAPACADKDVGVEASDTSELSDTASGNADGSNSANTDASGGDDASANVDGSDQDSGSVDAGPDDSTPVVILTGTAELIRVALEAQTDRLPAYQDAALRLISALEGGEPDGVTVTMSGASKRCSVLADLDADGSRETTIAVNLAYETSEMADDEAVRLSISLGLPGEPLVSVSALITPVADSKAEVTEASAQLETPEVSIYGTEGEGSLAPDAAPGDELVTMKYSSFDAGYRDRVDGRFTLILSEDGYRLRVEIADDPSTPENEATEFFIDGRISL